MQPSLRIVSADGIDLNLHVTDVEVLAELQRLPDPAEREAFALAALRIGILAIRQAGGAVDERALRDAGKALVSDVARVMNEHQLQTVTRIEKEMQSYFDRSSGKVPQFLDELVKPGGNLDRMMRQHLGGDTSTLAQTLTQHVGSQSPLLTMLSPEQKTGLLARVEDLVKKNLEEQRSTLLGEFDLNKEQSALSRLVRQMQDGQGSLEKNFKETIGKLASEWSLDNENSSVAKFKRDVAASMEKMFLGQTAFQQAVMKELEGLRQKRASEAVSTAKGATFEVALGDVLRAEAQKAREIFQPVGLHVGEIKNCKKGDFVHEFGPESAAPGERVVVEAKDDAAYGHKEALEELGIARPNRKAQVGIFVLSSAVAPEGMARFQRFGNDIVLVWDKDDPATDLWLLAGLELARALVVRRARAAAETSTSLAEIDTAIAQLEKDATGLQNIAIYANTVTGAAEKIRDEVEKMQKKIAKQIGAMREGIEALKGTGTA
ncbi:MAG: hypothetical protein K8T20_03670 [Planctomycetes bacterium]|nr:hypothetical protein [Planctomycetota bacterium]